MLTYTDVCWHILAHSGICCPRHASCADGGAYGFFFCIFFSILVYSASALAASEATHAQHQVCARSGQERAGRLRHHCSSRQTRGGAQLRWSQTRLQRGLSSCYICVLILLYMCPHTAIYVSSHCYICCLILQHLCPC
jgi:hypothetical protein